MSVYLIRFECLATKRFRPLQESGSGEIMEIVRPLSCEGQTVNSIAFDTLAAETSGIAGLGVGSDGKLQMGLGVL